MAFRILGSIMVLAATSLMGYALALDLKKRPQELRELQGLFQMLENEIGYMSSLIADAFDRLQSAADSPVGGFFGCAAKNIRENDKLDATGAWELAVKSVLKDTALTEEDARVLVSFGKSLGKSDIDGQLKNIRLAVEQLKLQERKAEEKRARNEGMYRRLGILAGAAIVIILF